MTVADFELEEPEYLLTWPEGHKYHGLEVRMLGLTVGALTKVIGGSRALSGQGDMAAKAEAAAGVFGTLAENLVSWNLKVRGVPVPATPEGVTSRDLNFVTDLVLAWIEAVSGVDTPLPSPSPNGVTTATAAQLAASLPMAPLSPSPSS